MADGFRARMHYWYFRWTFVEHSKCANAIFSQRKIRLSRKTMDADTEPHTQTHIHTVMHIHTPCMNRMVVYDISQMQPNKTYENGQNDDREHKKKHTKNNNKKLAFVLSPLVHSNRIRMNVTRSNTPRHGQNTLKGNGK